MKTTLELPAPVLRRAKLEAAQSGISVSEFLSRLVAGYAHPRKARSHRVRLPLVRGDGKRLINPSRKQLDASLWD